MSSSKSFLFFTERLWQIAIKLFKNNLIVSYFNFITINYKSIKFQETPDKIYFSSKPADGDVGEILFFCKTAAHTAFWSNVNPFV